MNKKLKLILIILGIVALLFLIVFSILYYQEATSRAALEESIKQYEALLNV